MEKNYFRLFANCLPVDGASRNVICDLQRSEIVYISDFQFDLLTKHKEKSRDELIEIIPASEIAMMDQFFEYLEERELGMWCDIPDQFPPISMDWDIPAFISNAIIDFDQHSDFNFPSIFKQLEELGCQAIQLRHYSSVTPEHISKILESLLLSRINCVELILPFTEQWNKDAIEQLCWQNRRIRTIHLHTAESTKVWELDPELKINVTSSTDPIHGHESCGFIHPSMFVLNSMTFREGQRHNTCLNRKIGVDIHGNIKNCPSMEQSYGHVDEISLKEVIENESFTNLWHVHKDQIKTCKTCEFRYVCTDCRAFLSGKDIQTAKPAKCNYNPATMSWEN